MSSSRPPSRDVNQGVLGDLRVDALALSDLLEVRDWGLVISQKLLDGELTNEDLAGNRDGFANDDLRDDWDDAQDSETKDVIDTEVAGFVDDFNAAQGAKDLVRHTPLSLSDIRRWQGLDRMEKVEYIRSGETFAENPDVNEYQQRQQEGLGQNSRRPLLLGLGVAAVAVAGVIL